MGREYEYKISNPTLPRGATSPVMSGREMEDWLNEMDGHGWELVGLTFKEWAGSYGEKTMQRWWVWKRPFKNSRSKA